MVSIQFHIHYFTTSQDYIAVDYYCNSNEEQIERLSLHTYGGGHWVGELNIKPADTFHYRYIVASGDTSSSEAGNFRKLHLIRNDVKYFLDDFWRDHNNPIRIFHSKAFTEVINKPEGTIPLKSPDGPHQIQIQLNAPEIPVGYTVGIVGNIKALGNWKTPVLMVNKSFPLWQLLIPVSEEHIDLEYKYVLCDPHSGDIFQWEEGENRNLSFHFPETDARILCHTDEGFRKKTFNWKGAGIAIPVFSLRSKKGMGIGEFPDLKGMIDFAAQTGMNMVQVLPVNDTIAAKTWKDSYPYSAISVFALHPLYINLEDVASFKNAADQKKYEKARKELNKLEVIDFVKVLEIKMALLHKLYEEQGSSLFRTKKYKQYFDENKEWLVPYAAFSHLRDVNGTANFREWKEFSIYNKKEIDQLTGKKSKVYKEIAFYYFVQFHADRQLKEAKAYGHNKRVVLKGDLPIGVYRYSCDAWVAPHLYNMNGQAGAPPDDYAIDGQNWGFPTYNWEVMAQDDFLWWKKRMQSLANYFDALRIDHILGFFRIWQIPLSQISGIMGMFNPRLPIALEELYTHGITGDIRRYTHPYIREYMLDDIFGEDKEIVKEEFLNVEWEEAYSLKESVNTQVKIEEKFKEKIYEKLQHLMTPLKRLVGEVLLLEEPESGGTAFNPRISLQRTYSYKALDPSERAIWDRIYNDYFYQRHNEFWKKQALWKLPYLLEATEMLICGEDLGMIPATVPEVMKQLNIIPLEIQRMPKGNTAYGIPSQYDYFSVCSPSCHDMSTIRGWWEADPDNAQRFYNMHMHRGGMAPSTCTTEIVQSVNREHLDAPSILAIFPIQDLLGMDENLRKEDAASEQINVPADPNHYWRYRLHLNIEALNEEKSFIDKVQSLVHASGR
jgi:4-alpha-glucanotransferase